MKKTFSPYRQLFVIATACLAIPSVTGVNSHAATRPHVKSENPTTETTCQKVRNSLAEMRPGDVICSERASVSASTPAVRRWLSSLQAGAAAAPLNCKLGKVVLERHRSCTLDVISVEVFRPPITAPIGTGLVGVASLTRAWHNKRSWSHRVRLGLFEATGVVLSVGISGNVTIACGRGAKRCLPSPGATKPLPYLQNVHYPFTIKSPGNARLTHRPTSMVSITYRASTAPPLAKAPSGAVRCDSTPRITNRFGGCVFPAYVPSFSLSTRDSKVDQAAWHIYWAQHNLKHKWGWKGHGRPLSRTTTRAIIIRNRQVACAAAPRPRPPGKECDEYPLASTYQGASRNKDFSWRLIPRSDNRNAGGSNYLLKFYRENRILDGDRFWVHIVT